MFSNILNIKEDWVVFFDLFSKNYNGDSTRPLAEMLRTKMPDAKFFFVCSEKKKVNKIDMADEVLVNKSIKFNYMCKRAKYIISPMGFPRIKKRKGQVFVQTWHGSPLKKLYLSKDKSNRRYKRYASLFRETDIFCSQGEIHNKNLAEAYWERAQVLFDQRKYAIALNDYIKYSSMNKDSAAAQYNAGICLYNTGKKQAAIPYIERAKNIAQRVGDKELYNKCVNMINNMKGYNRGWY